MNHWLVKSEPDAFSWEQQMARGTEPWTGVRSHQAKRNLMAMRLGDLAFFYHSNIGKAVVGVVAVSREHFPDATADAADKGDWVAVEMRAVSPFPVPVTLAAVKATPALAAMALVRSARLSVQPVTAQEWALVCKMGNWKPPRKGRKPA